MALFHHHHRRPRNISHPRESIRQTPLPEYYKHLNEALCDCLQNHPLPVRMTFIGWGASDQGQPMAIYACPHGGCSARQGWVKDFRTRRPYLSIYQTTVI